LGAAGGEVSIRMNDPSQLQRFSQDTDRGSYSRLRPKLAAAHHVAWVVVLLTSGIVALALGHFEIGLAAVLLRDTCCQEAVDVAGLVTRWLGR
jgi:hypothetical protein